jgi:MinD superfamily P-loop ATPase
LAETIWPEIDEVLCTGCGDCLSACRPQALVLAGGKAVLARPDVCEFDGGCEPACPVGAIALPYLVVFDPGGAGLRDPSRRG